MKKKTRNRLTLLGLIFLIIVIIICGNGPDIFQNTNIEKNNDDSQNIISPTYKFYAEGKNCVGITYTWMTDLGVTALCHERFTNGDFLKDCPVPKTVSEKLELPDHPYSSIHVSKSSECIVRCEIWISGELVDSEEDELIVSCEY